jgi:hypothetical protein
VSFEVPMDAAEEAAFFAHIARIEALRDARRLRLEGAADPALLGTPWDPTLPAFLRRQAD